MNYPTEPDLTIKPGERVRSFDTPNSTDDYVEGIVEGIVAHNDVQSYKIVVQFRCIEGRRLPKLAAEYAFAPVNGLETTYGRISCGVARVPPYYE